MTFEYRMDHDYMAFLQGQVKKQGLLIIELNSKIESMENQATVEWANKPASGVLTKRLQAAETNHD